MEFVVPLLLLAQSLNGVVDLHVHCDPDSSPRSIDAMETAKLARDRGLRAILLKNHYEPTAGLAWLVSKQTAGIEVFGGIALNRTVGGINASAVDRLKKIKGGRARVVWMPTFDAENQVHYSKENRPFVAVSRDGKLLPEVVEVIRIIARDGLTLATGHSSPAEDLLLIREAKRAGVANIIVTHAMLAPVRMNVEQMREAAGLGAKLEFVYNALIGPSKMFEIEDYAKAIRAVGVDSCFLSSDLGQAGNPLHPDGLQSFMKGLAALGFTEAELDVMMRKVPARLVGLTAP
jgi:hypothetical protein